MEESSGNAPRNAKRADVESDTALNHATVRRRDARRVCVLLLTILLLAGVVLAIMFGIRGADKHS
jgi:hypothetical protein